MDKNPKYTLVEEDDEFGGRKRYRLQENDNKEKQQEEDKPFIESGRHLSTLIGRDQSVGKTKNLGKLQNIKKKKDLIKNSPFRCDVCKVSYSCNTSLLDHLNSASHNKNIGMNLKVKAVSASSIAEKLASLKSEPNKNKKQTKIQKFIEKQEQEEQERQKLKNKDEKDLKFEEGDNLPKVEANIEKIVQNQEEQEQESEEDELDQMRKLGLPVAFGSKKKKY